MSSTCFYPRGAMLTRVLAMGLCLSVCVCHTPVLYRNSGTHRADFRHGGLPSTYPALCFKEIILFENKGTSLWNFVPKSGLGTFGRGTSTVAECDRQFDSRLLLLKKLGNDGRRGNWVLSIVDRRRSALCTAQWAIGSSRGSVGVS